MDLSSQKPSDPADKPDSGNDSIPDSGEDKAQQKLKLKQLLTPLSSHLKVEKSDRDDKFDEFRPRMEIPRAVPIDPEPELAPHERPPSPDGAPLGPGQGHYGPDGLPIPPAGMGSIPGQQDQSMGITEESATEDTEDEMEELVSAPGEKPGLLRKIGLPLIALLIVIGAIQYFFDPLGLSIEPISPTGPVVLSESAKAPVEEAMPASMAPVTLSLELDKVTVESFLELIGKQVILSSERPHGAIIDSVFYPEGSTINPGLGLFVSSVKDNSITIKDNNGREYEFPAN